QLELAREERVQIRRAEAYVDLLDFTMRDMTRTGLMVPQLSTGDEGAMMPTAMDEATWWRMHARINAFGSREIRSLVDEFLATRVRFQNDVMGVVEARKMMTPGDHATIELLTEARARLEQRRQSLSAEARRIMEAVNGELVPTSGERRRWPWRR